MEDERGIYGNEASPQITPIEVNLDSEWEQQEVLFGTLHSQFERVQNYLFQINGEPRMLTIMCEGNTLLPDSIILRQEDYEDIKRQGEFPATKIEDYILISNRKIAQLRTSNGSLMKLSLDKFTEKNWKQKIEQIEDFIACSEKKSDLERLPRRYTDLLDAFVKGMLGAEPERIESSFLGMVGAGKGLTPAADDAVVGALAGTFFHLSLAEKQDTYFERTAGILFHLCREKLTTEISCKYLKCACRGAFSQTLCKLFQILTGEPADILKLLEQIAKMGHSSGMDMLYGLERSLSCMRENMRGKGNGKQNLSVRK